MKSYNQFMSDVNDVQEGIGMTMAHALGTPPPLSRRGRLKQALILRQIDKDTKEGKKKHYSGKAASPNLTNTK